MEELLTIQEAAARTGLSVHTLRYYERVGLIDPVNRAMSGHRRYTADDLFWIEFLQCLRNTGMPIRQMQIFADLRRQGAPAATELALLETHKRQVRQRIKELEERLAAIERKSQRVRKRLLTEQSRITPNIIVLQSN
ncbi:MerR family transcriptional regulator [Ktedonosporobacter rubrisoli]|uniref:MerR family transcriptional regulator n=1 Tax=Ktedonosporobacter rubrisoli TaxID=2509675 RepID=A0A4P6JKX7_KTERU|nr:MerR family transcriptional regulator [Ktedonosporobacter rubrisoli]QBD75824.1 MerR family transcriptional regulator [Ktedonosporobacter rubrisoli]